MRHRFILLFLALLTLSSVMIVQQVNANRARHMEVREAFLLLHAAGQLPEATRLYEWLIEGLQSEPLQNLLEDQQRFAILLDPSKGPQDNLVWRYHRSVSNELEKRGHGTKARALKLVGELR